MLTLESGDVVRHLGDDHPLEADLFRQGAHDGQDRVERDQGLHAGIFHHELEFVMRVQGIHVHDDARPPRMRHNRR